jgi:hypothetical protein
MKLEFNGFSKKSQISNFTKIRPVEAELFHVDGQTEGETDMTKLTVAFCNFANAPKNGQKFPNTSLHTVNKFYYTQPITFTLYK